LVIAKVFGPEMAGLYYFASRLVNVGSQPLSDALQKSSYPALSTLQTDNKKLREKYRQIIKISFFVVSPIMIILAALADVLFDLVFDESWHAAVVYTQLLCIVGIMYPAHNLNVNVLMVKGRSDLNLRLAIIKITIQVILLIASIPYGVIGVVTGQVIGTVIALIPNTYYTALLIDYGIKTQIKDTFRPILAGLFSASLILLLKEMDIIESTSLLFMTSAILGVAAYLCLSILLQVEGLKLLMTWLKSRSQPA
jgi:O-antigen/teichoic acid export membrane protein